MLLLLIVSGLGGPLPKAKLAPAQNVKGLKAKLWTEESEEV